MTRLQGLMKISSIFTLLFIFCIAVNAASGDVDTSFMPSFTKTPDGWVNDIIIQPDGKILISGVFTVVDGTGRNSIARLNADGTLDTTFNPPVFGALTTNLITSIKLQADGKIVVGGQFAFVNDFYSPIVVRLNADGSIDQSFDTNFVISGAATDVAVTPDGKIIVIGSFSSIGGSNVLKFNSDGSLDQSFQQGSSDTSLTRVVALPDGRFLLGSRSLKRFNADGTPDTTFSNATFGSSQGITDIEVLTDGAIMVTGSFTTVNGFNLKYLARLNSNGSIDPNFNVNNPGPGSPVSEVEQLADGRLLIGGAFSTYNTVPRSRAAILALDGELDQTFNPVLNQGSVLSAAQRPDGKIYLSNPTQVQGDRILKLYNLDGSIDNTFQTDIGYNQNVWAVLVQPDGKIVAGGQYRKANGVFKNSLARFNADGTLDTDFNPTAFGINQLVLGLDIQPDGKILAASNSGGTIRLNPNGSTDISFPSTQTSYDVKVLPDGKVLVATIPGGLKRFLSNGSPDISFNPTFIGGGVYKIKLQPDGKILIGGSFTAVNGVNRGRIARLNSDGTLDTTFNPPGGANSNVNDLDLQADGKVLIGGDFTGVNFTDRFYVARLNSDGTLDTSFNGSTNSPLLAVKAQSDGRILIGGSFNVVNGVVHRGYSRLNANGSTDPTFNQGYGANSAVRDITLQPDGKIILGGDFFNINGFGVVGLARLDNSPAVVRTRFDFDGDGRTDIGVFRPSSSVWYQLLGPNYQFSSANFGTSGDIAAPADFDGDGKTDLAIFRPSTGTFWYAASSQGGAFRAVQWGQSGDVPLPSDVNGDGRDDYVVYRAANNTWYRLTDTGEFSSLVFGTSGDKPLIGDFDGDGKADYAIFRPSTGTFWYAASSQGNAFRAVQWGSSGDIAVPADYDGDGKTDYAVYRPTSGVWYILNSSTNAATIIQFGLSADKPVAADYDGDGKADIAVYRPSTGEWYILRSSAGFFGLQFGISEDVPLPNAFIQ